MSEKYEETYSLKRDIKIQSSVADYYRKLGDDVGNTPTGKMLTKVEQKHLKALYYQRALEVEREEQEALVMYKKRNFKRGK
jgi:nitrogenase subunit NifH